MDDQIVNAVCEQITAQVEHITADKMYDTMQFTKHWKSTFLMLTLSSHRKIIRLQTIIITLSE